MDNMKKRMVALIIGMFVVFSAIVLEIVLATQSLNDTATKEVVFKYLLTIFRVLALVSAFVYIASGFKKSSAKLLNVVVLLFALSQLLDIIGMILNGVPLITIVISIVIYGLLNVLLIARDLGKFKSLLIVYSIIGLKVLTMTLFIVLWDVNILILLTRNIAYITLPIVLATAIHLKYYDKELRKGKELGKK